MKTKFAAIILMMLSVNALAGQEVVQIIDSQPVYDTQVVENRCSWNPALARRVCEATARPDKPFPLPQHFNVTVKRSDGTIVKMPSNQNYFAGERVIMNNTD